MFYSENENRFYQTLHILQLSFLTITAVTSYTLICFGFSLNEALQYKTEHLFEQIQTQHIMTKTHMKLR